MVVYPFLSAVTKTAESSNTVEMLESLTIEMVILYMAIASLVFIAVKRIKIPYTIALVLVGLLLSYFHVVPPVELSPKLVLYTFLPALLFEAAWNLNLNHLKQKLGAIVIAAVFGLLLSVITIGVMLHFGLQMDLWTALLFGAMISATDPVSVLALFKKLGVDHNISALVEGESLFNDGTAVVVFKLILSFALLGGAFDQSMMTTMLTEGTVQFLLVVGGGLFVGSVLGYVFSYLTGQFDDHLLEVTFTTLVAYGSFLLAESIPVPGGAHVHLSGVIATVTAGLVVGNVGREKGMSPTTRLVISSFWEYAGFVVNSLIFLLIGLEMQMVDLSSTWMYILAAIGVVLAGRVVAVYTSVFLANQTLNTAIPLAWQHILVWGGLRGALSMALVLSLPVDFPERSTLIAMVFGVVFFSLIVQGLSIPKLLDFLGLNHPVSEKLLHYQSIKGQLIANKRALAHLEDLERKGLAVKSTLDHVEAELCEKIKTLEEEVASLHQSDEMIREEELMEVRMQVLTAKKSVFNDMVKHGLLSEDVSEKQLFELNESIELLQKNKTELMTESGEL